MVGAKNEWFFLWTRCGLKERKKSVPGAISNSSKMTAWRWGVTGTPTERRHTEYAPKDWLREQWPSKWKATRKRTRSKHLLESERKFIRDRFSHQSSKNMTVSCLFSHPSPYSSPVSSNTTSGGRWIKRLLDVSQPLPTSGIWSSNCRLHKKQKGSEIGTLTEEWNIGANLRQNARFVTWWSI